MPFALALTTLLGAAGFSFTLTGGVGPLSRAALTSAAAVERCVGDRPGPVVVLLFHGHEGLVVELRAAPQGSEDCLRQAFRALELTDVQPHDSVTLVAGNGAGEAKVSWPSSSLEVIDLDLTPALKTAFDRAAKPNVDEGFAHAPLFRRCARGEHQVALTVRRDGAVSRATGTTDACVLEVLRGLRFPQPGTVRLKLRLD